MSVMNREPAASICVVELQPIGAENKVAPKEIVDDYLRLYLEGCLPEQHRREIGHAIVQGLIEQPQEPPHMIEMVVPQTSR